MEAFTGSSAIDRCFEQIAERRLPAGGFSEHLRGLYRPDATAWAVLALARSQAHVAYADDGRSALAASQMEDGSIAFPAAPDVIWPTAIGVLAWHGSAAFAPVEDRAIRFLLKTTGTHGRRSPNSPAAHDTSLKGWPWNQKTHSFVDPTCMALLALEVNRKVDHERFTEAIHMLMDRQLSRGGWNYGNTLVYGKQLHPFAETTGITLAALSGHVKREQIEKSLALLRAYAKKSRTPLSLAWALFGLGAWGEFPPDGFAWIEETLVRQEKYGAFGTSLLSLLALAYSCRGDILKCAGNAH